MSYHYLDHLTWADVAFEASAPSLDALFSSAAEAVLNVMVSDLSSVQVRETRKLRIHSESGVLESAADPLLRGFLQKLIFYKDAEQLLLKPRSLHIVPEEGGYTLTAELVGETIDPRRHELVTDVKAVTMHHFSVKRVDAGWNASVVLDV